MLEKLDASLVDTYAKKTGCTPEKIAGWMKAETWFSAGESVERGFADRVAEAAPKAQADWNLSVYANAPVVPAAAGFPSTLRTANGTSVPPACLP